MAGAFGADPTPVVAVAQVLSGLDVPDGTGHLHQTAALGPELRDRVFAPLELDDTSCPSEADLTLPEPYIRGYERTAVGWRECSQQFFGRGDGALVSTAADLAAFFRALLVERRLLPEGLLHQIMSVLPDGPPAAKSYGLGLIADPCRVVRCGVTPALAVPALGKRPLCHLHGQRQLWLSRGVPAIGRGAARPFTWGQSQRVLLTDRFTRVEATAPALFRSAPGLGIPT